MSNIIGSPVWPPDAHIFTAIATNRCKPKVILSLNINFGKFKAQFY